MTTHRPGKTAKDPGEFDRLAGLTIQGGGAYGLNMLDQLAAVIEQFGITPLAYAGTSAGAVVAALSWAGYSPKEIRSLFVKLAMDAIGLKEDGLSPGAPRTVVDLLAHVWGEETEAGWPRAQKRLFFQALHGRRQLADPKSVVTTLDGQSRLFPDLST